MSSIGIVGQGAWGSALGANFRSAGSDVVCWARGDDPSVVADAEIVLMAVPAQATRSVLEILAPALSRDARLVLTAKGLERGTLMRQSEIAAELAGHLRVAVLSGPSFATDLARGLPTAVTLAASDGEALQACLSTPSLRLYLTDDVVGTELGGTLKNVIAIACGAVIGAGMGDSARAALMARGFSEMTRIGTKMGARAETLAGLSGLGDLALTCSSAHSRNFRYGFSLGESGSAPRDGTFEGAATAGAALALAQKLDVDAPVIGAVAALVDGEMTVQEAMVRLMTRPLRRE